MERLHSRSTVAAGVLAVLACTSIAREHPGPQGDADAPASTQLEYNDAWLAYATAETTDRYRATTVDPPGLTDRVARFLDACHRAEADKGGTPSWSELYDEGVAILDAGCDHPLVVDYVANLHRFQGRILRAVELLESVDKQLSGGEFGARARFYHAWRLMLAKDRFGQNRVDPLPQVDRAVRAFVQLAAEQNDRGRQRFHWSALQGLFADAWRPDKRRLLTESVAGEDAIHPWLRAMLAGLHAHTLAWDSRGGKFAHKVTEDQWAGFREHLPVAKSAFLEAFDLEPGFPEAATAMISIAVADGESTREDIEMWFERARAAQYDYTPAYESLLNAMLPRWSGSHQLMFRHAYGWLQEKRFETNVPFMTVRAIIDIGNDTGDLRAVLGRDGPFYAAMAALEGMAEHPTHAPSERLAYARPALLTQQLALAMLAGRDERARQILDAIVDEGLACDESTMHWNKLTPGLYIPRLYARTGAAAEECRALGARSWQQLRGDRDALIDTVAAYRAAKQATDDPRADPYFDRWIGVYQREVDFLDGKWVELPFDERFSAWGLPITGMWEVEGPTAAVSRQTNRAAVPELWCENYFPGPLEVECDLQIIESTGEWAFAAVRLGGSTANEYLPLYFGVNGADRHVAVVSEDGRVRWDLIEPRGRRRLSVRAWPGYFEVAVDGEVRIESADPDFHPEGRIALETFPRGANHVAARYANVRVKRLAPRSEPEEDPAAEPAATND